MIAKGLPAKTMILFSGKNCGRGIVVARSVPKAGGLLPDGLWNVTTDSPLTGDPHKIEKRLLNLSFGSFLKFKSAFFALRKAFFSLILLIAS